MFLFTCNAYAFKQLGIRVLIIVFIPGGAAAMAVLAAPLTLLYLRRETAPGPAALAQLPPTLDSLSTLESLM